MSGWAKIKIAAAYASVSTRTVRNWLKMGLQHSRLPSGAILIEYTSIDAFLRSFEVEPESNKIDQVVDEILGIKDNCILK